MIGQEDVFDQVRLRSLGGVLDIDLVLGGGYPPLDPVADGALVCG